jgi:4,5-DOPA dioxygenase extradiol
MSEPSVFVSHGSPMVGIETGPYQDALTTFGAKHHPAAVIAVSAHWASGNVVRIASGAHPALIYDFGGFPQALFDLRYDAPGSPELAARIAETLGGGGQPAQLDPARGWDHGVWIPLRLMYAAASVPVVEVSIPLTLSPAQLYHIGELLRPFRKEGVMVLGSGGVVHNLSLVDFANRDRAPDRWAMEFDNWLKDKLSAWDLDALFDYARLAPHASRAVPTPEHFVPVFVTIGAAAKNSVVYHFHESFQHGNISMRGFIS